MMRGRLNDRQEANQADFLLSHGLRCEKQVTPISRISRFIFKQILNGMNVECRAIADQEVR
jgi:hypothetical protein